MDNIWDRNHSKSEVIGRCGGDENTDTEPTKSKAKKREKKGRLFYT